jgi:hypothetical protein
MSATRTVKAADAPTLYRRTLAALASVLGLCVASRRVFEPMNGVYGVSVDFHLQPSLVAY